MFGSPITKLFLSTLSSKREANCLHSKKYFGIPKVIINSNYSLLALILNGVDVVVVVLVVVDAILVGQQIVLNRLSQIVGISFNL